jgi:SET domain-containing protein
MNKINKLINNDLVSIKKSNIEGLGVFAKEDIPKGTKIADYYGKEMTWKSFKNKYGEYKLNSLHTYPMRRIWKIIVAKEEPYKSRNLTNYINEIRGKANCELKLRALYAKKDIKKGTELLLEYPEDYNRFWLKNKTNKMKTNKMKINKTKTRKNKK